MTSRAVVLAFVAALLGAAVPASLAAPAQKQAGGTVTLHIRERGDANAPKDVVSGRGRFRISGAINDRGTTRAHRTVKSTTVVIRRVMTGKKGTFRLVLTIPKAGGDKTWKITSGTRAYKGLHGKGAPGGARRPSPANPENLRGEGKRPPGEGRGLVAPAAPADLRAWFLEGVGDRVLEAQRAAFARGGVPCVGPAPCAGGLEERLIEPGLDRILGLS